MSATSHGKAPELRTIYLVTGMLSNLRGTIKEAIVSGRADGFDVRVLDLVHVIPGWAPYPNPWSELGVAPERVVTPESFQALKSLCRTRFSASDLFIFLHLPIGELSRVWKMLRRMGSQVGPLTVSLVPSATLASTGIIGSLLGGIRQALRGVKTLTKPTPDFWIYSGEIARKQFSGYFKSCRNTRFVQTHSPDFESSRKLKTLETPTEPYILFLDQGWHSKPRPAFLSDAEYPPTRYEVYQRGILKALRELEDASGCRVIVSAHPKASLSDTRELYRGMQVLDESTASLAGQARFLIGNSTTSLQFAPIHRRPVLLFTSNELNSSVMHQAMQGFKDVLDTTFVNIDEPNDWKTVITKLEVSKEAYDQYLTDYIGDTGSLHESMWQKVFAKLG